MEKAISKRWKKPNSETIKAIEEARTGKGVQCKDLNDFFKRLFE
jgi:antitoxin component of RelBE/YafQ-DinJ toxin-antitoxin module